MFPEAKIPNFVAVGYKHMKSHEMLSRFFISLFIAYNMQGGQCRLTVQLLLLCCSRPNFAVLALASVIMLQMNYFIYCVDLTRSLNSTGNVKWLFRCSQWNCAKLSLALKDEWRQFIGVLQHSGQSCIIFLTLTVTPLGNIFLVSHHNDEALIGRDNRVFSGLAVFQT
jgi:hypothetical protein